ncbi:MAG: hypothetical protein AAGA75_27645 [Cyanobacteria bacterium P01_E01_bin.6]
MKRNLPNLVSPAQRATQDWGFWFYYVQILIGLVGSGREKAEFFNS